MSRSALPQLSRRERQIMDVIFGLGRATAREVHEGIADAPSYSAVRALLRVLETKGHLTHVEDGPRYLFIPTMSRAKARTLALRQLVDTFWEGSASRTVAALIDSRDHPISQVELDELAALIASARAKGR
ncbi:MAG: BlaI/MecI/CopY family transcriptional regulator [Gemmatimonadetes bacterium]|jgi:predicted transcriptional regulator|nr:BlaI/MecI/CopY family transcriptional regulator [Gemmatimonadota bacterium]MBP6443919.1 BlaI/MecI/CopY family transcriptional regulator [Gemmatimonadales bacterium]MBK9550300.1 BlaI/MecI/CopY family transcriptional regulator [Gemmatimonadota bacterium]MBP6570468.1 BlaI/MecI/CopY family transcriptional regulator [Gemmatimonadales bacterium]MBP7619825.1 BlaI/MecI/CopY family transcriptional regulator [Gemmatimonadales bacterium]